MDDHDLFSFIAFFLISNADFKLMLYVFKCISGLAPLCYKIRPRLNTGIDSNPHLTPPDSGFRGLENRAGDSSFNAVAPRLWNDLPAPLWESVLSLCSGVS